MDAGDIEQLTRNGCIKLENGQYGEFPHLFLDMPLTQN